MLINTTYQAAVSAPSIERKQLDSAFEEL